MNASRSTRTASAVAGAVAALAGTSGLMAETIVGGPIFVDTTWAAADGPFLVTSSVVVGVDATLTIEAGSEVRIDPGLGIQIGSDGFGGGAIVARGTAGSPILITSGVVPPGVPAAGDWNSLSLTESTLDAERDGSGNYLSGSILEHVIIEYGGGGSTSTGSITIDQCSPFLADLEIRDSVRSGIRADATSSPSIFVVDSTFIRCGTTSIDGGGIRLVGGSGHAVSGCRFEDDTASRGGGLYLDAPSSSVVDNEFVGNFGSSLGGGVWLRSASGSVEDNEVTGNGGSQAAGMYLNGMANGSIRGNVVSSNVATSNVGGMYIDGTFTGLVAESNLVTMNSGAAIGGVYFVGNGGATFNGNTVRENTATSASGDAGGLRVGASGSTISDNTISDNTAGDNAGGVWVDGSTVMFSGNVVSGNTASTGEGGGLLATSTGGQYSGNTVIDNFAGGSGGGMYVETGATNTSLTGNTVTGNEALSSGGALYWRATGGSIAGTEESFNVLAGNIAPVAPSVRYAVANGNDLAAQNVCWGLFDGGAITESIHDFFDDSTLGFVLFVPFITDPGCVPDDLCEGDVDGSGDVGFADLLGILTDFGPCPGGGAPCPSDADGDGEVGFQDVLYVLTRWGPCP